MSRPVQPVLAYLLPDPGIPVGGTKGASVHVESLTSALARAGARVVLFAANVVGPLQAPGSETVEVVPVPVGPVRGGDDFEKSRTRAATRFFDTVATRLQTLRPDWVHERLSLFAGAGTALCAGAGLPRVVEVNAPVAEERARHFGLSDLGAAHAREREALTGARVLAVSEPLARWARRQGAAEAVVVPNGADTATLDPVRWARHRATTRQQLGLTGRVVIGFAGSLKPWHGVDVLIEALHQTRTNEPLGLLVVGDGPGRTRLAEQVEGLAPAIHPVLTGAVPFAVVPRMLAAMDIAVAPYLPSQDFYFSPLKVAEAMSAGLAVVASDFAPVRELLAGTGRLVRPGDAAELAEVLAELADNPTARAELARTARQRAVDRLDWAAVARRTLDFSMAASLEGTPAARSA